MDKKRAHTFSNLLMDNENFTEVDEKELVYIFNIWGRCEVSVYPTVRNVVSFVYIQQMGTM